jgi:hypothetical protein
VSRFGSSFNGANSVKRGGAGLVKRCQAARCVHVLVMDSGDRFRLREVAQAAGSVMSPQGKTSGR